MDPDGGHSGADPPPASDDKSLTVEGEGMLEQADLGLDDLHADLAAPFDSSLDQELEALYEPLIPDLCWHRPAPPGEASTDAQDDDSIPDGDKKPAARPYDASPAQLDPFAAEPFHDKRAAQTDVSLSSEKRLRTDTDPSHVPAAASLPTSLSGGDSWVRSSAQLQELSSTGIPFEGLQPTQEIMDRLGVPRQHEAFGRWCRNYNDLIKYRHQHGHCNAPQKTELGRFVNKQRNERREYDQRVRHGHDHKRDWLNEMKFKLLDNLGFTWKTFTRGSDNWEKHFQSLVEYRREHGHCSAPTKNKKDTPFGRWITRVREEYKKLEGSSFLNEERVARLNEIGFVWRAFENSERSSSDGETSKGEGGSRGKSSGNDEDDSDEDGQPNVEEV